TLTTYALEEGGIRRWGTEVTGFGGKDGWVSHVYARQVTGTSSRDLTPVPGSEFVLEADLALIAIGFEHPEHEGLVAQLGLELDRRGNVRTRRVERGGRPDPPPRGRGGGHRAARRRVLHRPGGAGTLKAGQGRLAARRGRPGALPWGPRACLGPRILGKYAYTTG